MNTITDRDLLFAALALKAALVEPDRLSTGLRNLSNSSSLGQQLTDSGALTKEDRATIENLVEAHLRRHGRDERRALDGFRSVLSSLDVGWTSVRGPDDSPRAVPDTVAHAAQDHHRPDGAPPAVPRYEKRGFHKRGGLGQVWKATDHELNRTVALKEVQEQYVADPGSRNRLEAEAEITAKLEHPGVVPVYGRGDDARSGPYYAMRFIEGQPLTRAIADFHGLPRNGHAIRRVELGALLRRFVDVCNTVAYAHSRNVLHRDLKPENIMLGSFGETVVIDWGLAKDLTRTGDDPTPAEAATGDSGQTVGAIGTIPYMAPEASEARASYRSDVYSLGATLYHLLTNRPPVDGRDVGDLVQRLRTGKFPSPRAIEPEVPAALEAICMKALAVRAEDRYASASELANDVDRWLAGVPVVAWREPLWMRIRRWLLRHRTATTVLASVMPVALLASAVGLVLLNNAWREARRETTRAEESAGWAERQRQATDDQVYLLRIALAERAWRESEITRAVDHLAECVPPDGKPDRRGWEWYYLMRLCHSERLVFDRHTDTVQDVAFSPDGRTVASASVDGVRLWRADTGEELRLIPAHPKGTYRVRFDGTGTRLATSGADRTVCVWDLPANRELARFKGGEGTLSPDGASLVWESEDRVVTVYDLTTQRELMSFRGHNARINDLSVSRDSRRVASVTGGNFNEPGQVKVWDVATGKEVQSFRGHSEMTTGVAYKHDGNQIATCGFDGSVRLWNLVDGQQAVSFVGHRSYARSVDFSADGRRLVTGSDDRTVRVWDCANGREELILRGSLGPVRKVAFSPDGRRVAAASDQLVRIWDATYQEGEGQPLMTAGKQDPINVVAIAADGRVAASGMDGTLRVWDLDTGRETLSFPADNSTVNKLKYSRDGKWIVSGGGDGRVRIWDSHNGKARPSLKGHDKPISDLAFTPDETRLLSASHDGSIRVWDFKAGTLAAVLASYQTAVGAFAVSPDGRRVASGGEDGVIRICELDSGRELLSVTGHQHPVTSLAYSPDGMWLATSAGVREKPGEVKLWYAKSGEQFGSFAGHSDNVNSVIFSGDGRRLVTGSDDQSIILWDIATGQEALTLHGHHGLYNFVNTVAFSPDGGFLVSGSMGVPEQTVPTVKVWRTTLSTPKAGIVPPGTRSPNP